MRLLVTGAAGQLGQEMTARLSGSHEVTTWTRADVDLARHGDELVVTVGSYRRLFALPAALARHEVAGARVEDGSLRVRFQIVREATHG